ncbi:MAG: hypothetical protein NWQ54_10545 [Paraglaciecola sp.]|nr:hypothetical protein [Paraglaciecola sp.]
MPVKTSILKELMSASILLAVATSLLYLSGVSYISSYLTAWGIESSLFTPSIQDALVLGSGNWFFGGIYIAIFATIIGVIFYLSFYTLSELSKIRFVRNLASVIYEILKPKQRAELEPPAFIETIIARSLQFLMLIGVLLALLFIFHRLIAFSSSLGAENAQRKYVEFSIGNNLEQDLFTRMKILKIGDSEVRGYILANSDSLIALYLPPSDTTQEQVTIIPLNSISEIRAMKPAAD